MENNRLGFSKIFEDVDVRHRNILYGGNLTKNVMSHNQGIDCSLFFLTLMFVHISYKCGFGIESAGINLLFYASKNNATPMPNKSNCMPVPCSSK